MTPADLERLAEACENGAMWLRWLRTSAQDERMIVPTERIERELEAHARAIRAGRVTVTEEEGNGTSQA